MTRTFQHHETIAERSSAREEFKTLLSELRERLERLPPKHWWIATYRWIRASQTNDHLSQPVKDYIQHRFAQALELLKTCHEEEAYPTDQVRIEQAKKVMHDLGEHLLPPETHESEIPLPQRMGWRELMELSPNIRYEQTRRGPSLFVRANETAEWTALPCPRSSRVMVKGGPARLLLKIAVGAHPDLIASELPLNDVDTVIEASDDQGFQESVSLGADPAGIEQVPSLENRGHLLDTRDLDINQCFLTQDGLLFSEEAEVALKQGVARLGGKERPLYGSETFHYQGEELIKNRGMFRLLKFLAEGKILGFYTTKLNAQIDFGIYWLVLARKLAKKKNAAELLDRLHQAAVRSGHVPEGQDIFDILRYERSQYPSFRFQSADLDDTGVALWLLGKLFRAVDRDFRYFHKIPTDLQLERAPGDTRPFLVHLNRYETHPERIAFLQDQLERFFDEEHFREDVAA